MVLALGVESNKNQNVGAMSVEKCRCYDLEVVLMSGCRVGMANGEVKMVKEADPVRRGRITITTTRAEAKMVRPGNRIEILLARSRNGGYQTRGKQ